MRKLSLILLALLFAGKAFSQCAANFSEIATPNGSHALQHRFTNLTSLAGLTTGKTVYMTLIFGDGTSYFANGSWVSVVHDYPATGTFTAKLTMAVYDSAAQAIVCTDTLQKTITVSYSPCSFTTSSTKINDSTFSFSASSVSGLSPLSYTWNFGDGTSAAGASVIHTYSATGYYTVTATSTGTGCSDTGLIHLSALRIPPFTCGSISKSMYVSSNQQMAYVSANASISPMYPTLKKSFTYNYGDGSATTSSNQHAYTAVGTYHISAYFVCTDSLTSAVLCRDTLRDTVNILQVPGPCAFTVSSTKINDSTFSFTATSLYSTPGLTYTWSFGDGTSGTGSNPTHTYSNIGYYVVGVASAGTGCSDTNSTYVHASWNPPFWCGAITKGTSVSAINQTAYINAYANTTAYYPGLQMHYQFNYGDGSAVSTSSVHAYSAMGKYYVKAYFSCIDTVTSNVLCRDTLTDSVVITSLYSSVRGYLRYDSSTTPGLQSGIKVYLIVHDSAAGTLRAVDSTVTSGISWIYYEFQNVPAGAYLVKASGAAGVTSGTGLIPTYADSSVLWSSARTIYHSGVYDSYPVDIMMRTGTVTGGPGFIGGSVTLGANKGASAGAAGVSMILRNMGGDLVAMAETDAQGNYAFANIAVGTYTVMPELLNYDATASEPVTVSGSSATFTNLNFRKDDQKMSIRTNTLGVDKTPVPLVGISPVPAHGEVRITAGKQITAITPLEIRDLSGKVMLQNEIKPGGVLILDIRSLPAGMYFVQAGAGAPLKLIVQ